MYVTLHTGCIDSLCLSQDTFVTYHICILHSLCGIIIIWLLYKHKFPHEQSSISDFMDNDSIIFRRCSSYFPSKMKIDEEHLF